MMKRILFIFLLVNFIFVEISYAQNDSELLLGMLNKYAGMIDYDGKTFFASKFEKINGYKYKLYSNAKYANPKELILDLSKVDVSSIKQHRNITPEDGEFWHYSISFKSSGAILKEKYNDNPEKFYLVEIALAGKSLLIPTTYSQNTCHELAILISKVSTKGKTESTRPKTKSYRFTADWQLEKHLLSNAASFYLKRDGEQLLNKHKDGIHHMYNAKFVCIYFFLYKYKGSRDSYNNWDIAKDVSVNLNFKIKKITVSGKTKIAEYNAGFPNRANADPFRFCIPYSLENDKPWTPGTYEITVSTSNKVLFGEPIRIKIRN